ncbi:hypothetical protein MTR67_048394 [Solanum verrucosum]|uniref:Uncharacterized protein n=1 Tax=Solanum verrucosum TaxID=315347 RepID=A0AAF1A003_SOLVR|nr:hypothetical protein MTR67_048394 [Solanum verrucosum]
MSRTLVQERSEVPSVPATKSKDSPWNSSPGQTTARAGGPWFTTGTPSHPSSEKSAKSRLTDRPTVHRSYNGPWSMSVDQDLLYPTSDTNYG